MSDGLHQSGILYAPNYVINSGVLIKVRAEHMKTDASKLERAVRNIQHTLLDIFAQYKAKRAVRQRMSRQIGWRWSALRRS